ncbi:hypothetical protein DL98DRAFT_522166 [Cadophora sp. DSE1049]|nr:hypothetical protein DL98DRAFT_522166 [Cadophora sp. DSE1049]
MPQVSITKYLDMCSAGRARRKEIMRQERKAAKMPSPLTSFHLFPKLPTEIRMMIWELSLEARTVEIQWTETRGFFSRVPTPMALRVCKDSRGAVKSKYPLCFGNVLYKPSTSFNFSLDTLYVDHCFQNQALHFITSLSPDELASIRYLAVDSMLNEDFMGDSMVDWDPSAVCRKLASSMPALQEYLVVHDFFYWTWDDIEEGNGPMELYEDWPDGVWKQHYCDPDAYHYDEGIEDYTCELHELPGVDKLTAALKVPKVGSIWGWRSLKS